MQDKIEFETLADVLLIYFQQLLKNTHESVTQHYQDLQNYKHYHSKYAVMYMFYFVDEVCQKYSFTEHNHRYAVLMNIFTNTYSLSEEDAKEIVYKTFQIGIDASSYSVEQDWKLGQIIYRLAKRDSEEFTIETMTKQQIDNYNLLLLLSPGVMDSNA